MNIAIVHSAFNESGGAERLILQESLFLGKNHRVICYGTDVQAKHCFPDLISRVKTQEIVKVPLPVGHFVSSLLLTMPLVPHITSRFRNFDVILAHHQPGPWIGYNVRERWAIPYVCYVHHPLRFLYPRAVDLAAGWGYTPDRKIIGFFGRKLKGLREIDLISVGEADRILVNSRRIGGMVREIYGRPDFTVCYPSLNVDKYKPLSSFETKYVLEKYGVSKPFVLTSGRHTYTKRFEWLIGMMPEITRTVSSSLVICGQLTRDVTPILQETAKKLKVEKHVRIIGHVPERDLISLYNEASAYAYSPPLEDFGYGPVEAMACGTPAVVWGDEGGVRETVVNGETGFHAAPYDLADFAGKLIDLLVDGSLRDKLGRNAVALVNREFSMERHGGILEETLQSVAKKH